MSALPRRQPSDQVTPETLSSARAYDIRWRSCTTAQIPLLLDHHRRAHRFLGDGSLVDVDNVAAEPTTTTKARLTGSSIKLDYLTPPGRVRQPRSGVVICCGRRKIDHCRLRLRREPALLIAWGIPLEGMALRCDRASSYLPTSFALRIGRPSGGGERDWQTVAYETAKCCATKSLGAPCVEPLPLHWRFDDAGEPLNAALDATPRFSLPIAPVRPRVMRIDTVRTH